jgi:hypothetical protein
MQERNRSKVGRMARLKGTAEKISAAQVTNAVVADALEQMRAKE